MATFSHKPTGAKQINKGFKSRHSSKREVKRKNSGKVSTGSESTSSGGNRKASIVVGVSHVMSGKMKRKQKAKEMAEKKRSMVLHDKRVGAQVPRLVGIISLTPKVSAASIEQTLISSALLEEKPTTGNSSNSSAMVTTSTTTNAAGGMAVGAKTVMCSRWKSRLSFYAVNDRTSLAGLDIAKVADVLIFISDAEETCDELGLKTLRNIKAQALPTVISVVHGLDKANQKKKSQVKKNVAEFYQNQFSSTPKILPLGSPEDAQQILRFLSDIKIKKISWREFRPYMLVDTIDFQPYQGVGMAEFGTLKVSGYLRGNAINPNNVVHLTGYGDALIEKIEGGVDPYAKNRGPAKPKPQQHTGPSMELEANTGGLTFKAVVDYGLRELGRPNPLEQDTLVRENPPDPFASEQTWPTAEELEAAEKEVTMHKRKVPTGTSVYQAAWIPDDAAAIDNDDNDNENENEDNNDFGNDDDEEEDDGEDDFNVDIDVDKVESFDQFKELTKKKSEKETGKPQQQQQQQQQQQPQRQEDKQKQEQSRTTTEIAMGGDDDDDNDEDFGDESDGDDGMKAKRLKENMTINEEDEIDMQWPDEVDTPEDVSARIRFQKYRGLKSFRTSPWDPKENLPHDYAKIFQFENFLRTQKRLIKNHTGVDADQYISIYLKNIHVHQFANHPKGHPLIISGLLKFENKISVVNFQVTRTNHYTNPIKSKSEMEFHVGFRRWSGQAIFSENTHGLDKFKLHKFLRGHGVVSLYAPICFHPSPMLLINPVDGALVASGSMHSVDPDRIILKKIILTGDVVKSPKNKAIVRDMFFSPEDVRWFRPVELWTKYGRTGNIVEPCGTHGRMKCTFDGHVNNQDTVCMSLYKRIYPRWVKIPNLTTPATNTTTNTTNTNTSNNIIHTM